MNIIVILVGETEQTTKLPFKLLHKEPFVDIRGFIGSLVFVGSSAFISSSAFEGSSAYLYAALSL